jgi:DNA-directed RNA polymerase specialized sigma24 family protein
MNDSPKADDARDDFILQERLSGRSARSISKELHCPVSDIDESLDRTLPKITNEAKRRIIALDLDRLDELLKVFMARAIEKFDCQAGLLVVKILERKAALLGLDSPQKLDIVQLQAQKEPTDHERIRDAIMRVANSAPPAQRAVIKMMDELGPDEVLRRLNASNGNGSSEPSDRMH